MKQIHAVVWKEDKWYVAKALEFEVTSQGHSEKDSLKNLREALAIYFEDQENVDLAYIPTP
jgi:predicted RNase H-like HicB family nuclease